MTKSGFRIPALVLLGALLATNFYRAATQSIVHDEALTWDLYLAGPASAIFQFYSPNHHFLATILFRISTTFFGNSELAMRLPAVLAGAWFFWTVFQLCGLVFGDGWWFLLGCAVLTLNPILLDFLVAARGYGLAVAGLFWAVFQMVAWFHESGFDGRAHPIPEQQLRKRLWKAALGCSVAVSANLTLLFPAAVLAIAFCVMVLHAHEKPAPAAAPQASSKTRKKVKKPKPEAALQPTSPYAPLLQFVVPVILLAVAFLLAAPIDLARSQDFYAGTATAKQSLRNLMDVSFAYGPGFGALHEIERIWSNIALIFLPVTAVAALIVVSVTARPWRSMIALATWLASLAVVGSAILLLGVHLLTGLPYPVDRTGIYFVPLASLAALGLARMLTESSGLRRWTGVATAIVLGSFALEFAAQWNVNSFLVWRYDADTKRIFELIEAAPKPTSPIRLGVSWQLEPSLNYYRESRNATWMASVERDGFDGVRQFYAALPQDQETPRWPKLKQIYKGRISGTALAIPQAAQ